MPAGAGALSPWWMARASDWRRGTGPLLTARAIAVPPATTDITPRIAPRTWRDGAVRRNLFTFSEGTERPEPGLIHYLRTEVCRLFGMTGGERRVRATFWLLEAPDS